MTQNWFGGGGFDYIFLKLWLLSVITIILHNQGKI